jgi:predicted DsbA family dithiol-disulfide isomerase
MQVEIWSDIVCPWCYLGKHRFERALSSFDGRADVDVVYRSFELDPAAPRGQTTATVDLLATKYGMSREQAVAAQRQMEERAAADGLTFRMDGLRSGNTRDAHRLIQLARSASRQAEVVERLHKAYFTDQESVFDVDSLVRLATEAGLDQANAEQVLSGNEFDDAVAEDGRTASQLGATGVPFFVIGRRFAVSGAQPPEALASALEHAYAAGPPR